MDQTFNEELIQVNLKNGNLQAPQSSKRRKLKDAFECVVLNTSVESPTNASNLDNENMNVSSGIIQIQETINLNDSDCPNTVAGINCNLETNEVIRENVSINIASEVDPLLADDNLDQCKESDYITNSKKNSQNYKNKRPNSSEFEDSASKNQRTEPSTTTVSNDENNVKEEVVNEHADDGTLVVQMDDLTELNDNTTDYETLIDRSKRNMIGVNRVDNLLVNNFLSLSEEEQLEIKRLGPHRPTDIQIHQTDKKQNRFFSGRWFAKVHWLTASESKKRFFCFYCLLFGGEPTWAKNGYNNIKHLTERIKFHENSGVHINNAVKFKLFGGMNTTERNKLCTDSRTLLLRHNEIVDKNRHILSRILDCIKFCLAHELPLSEYRENIYPLNRKVFLGLVSEVASFDGAVHQHINDSDISSYTSETIQNELLDCMYHVYHEELKKDIAKANFVSVQVEKVANVSDKCRFAIILRFMKDCIAAERLLSFIEVDDHSAAGLTSAIKKELIPLNIRCKLIAQTYDGTVTMRGPYGGVQKCMKEFFPHALFVHCYAHSFGMIVRQACSTVSIIKTFFTNLSGFARFFTLPSKRTELLQVQCTKFPGTTESKWNTDSEIIRTVYHNQLALLACCQAMKDECGWDDESVWEATQFVDLLENREFLFFTGFFYAILRHIDILHNAFQSRVSCGDIMTALQDFETTIADMMEISEEIKTPDSELKIAANEACGIIISELRDRFEATDHLITFSVIDPNQFRKMSKFPHDHLQVLPCRYRMLTLGKLTSEMKVFYNNEIFSSVKSTCALLNFLAESELRATFSELCKLIEIALATPAAPINAENCISASEKLKRFLKTDMISDQMGVLATLMIHQDVIENIDSFNNRVIEYFTTIGTGKSQFWYKKL